MPRGVTLAAARVASWTEMLRMMRHARRIVVVAGIVINLALALLPLTVIVTTSVMLSEVPAITHSGERGHGWTVAVAAAAIAVGALILQQILAPFQTLILELVARDVDGVYVHKLMSLSLTRVSFARLECPETLDTLNDVRAPLLRSGSASPGEGTAALLALMTRYLQLAGAAALVEITLGPGSCAAITLIALIMRFGQRGSLAGFGRIWARSDAMRRKVHYLRTIGLSTLAAKEIRIFDSLPWLRQRHRADTDLYLMPLWRDRRQILGKPFIAYSLVAALGGAYVLSSLVDAIANHRVSLLELSVAIQAILLLMRFGVFFPECDIQTLYGSQACQSMAKFEGSILQDTVSAPTGIVRLSGRRPQREVRFENVSFSYGSSSRCVLDGLQLRLPAGRSTAIVGLNGSGKTTLVKLLAKLYEPDSGRILVDDQELRDVDAREWHRHLAIVFQDYNRYDFTFADNIAIGALDHFGDADAVLAAAKRAGAADILRSLPTGLETLLSSRYLGGQDLSGGQWQRIALARAFFAIQAGASLLILDEPTARLDIRAEARFYDEFLELTRGLTTLLISHRFASVRRADQIVVLDGGRIVEQGNHSSLLSLDGRYAHLFYLQAQSFTKPSTRDFATGRD